MTATASAAPAAATFYAGEFSGVAPFYVPNFAPDTTQDLAFSPRANSETSVNGIQPLEQTGIMVAEILDVDTTDLTFNAAYTAVTESATFNLSPANMFANVELKLQKSSTLVSCSGLGLSIVNYFHPYKTVAPMSTRTAAYVTSAGTTTLEQPSQVLPTGIGSNAPKVTSDGTAGSDAVDAALGGSTAKSTNHFYLPVPASIKFDEYYSYSPSTGALDAHMANEIVSPQFMATNRNITISLKLNPFVNLAAPYDGYAVPVDNGFSSGDLTFTDSTTSSGSLTIYRDGAYLPAGGNLVSSSNAGGVVLTSTPAEAASPLIHEWQRDIAEDSVLIGSGASYSYPLPQDGQVGLLAFYVKDPANPDLTPGPLLSGATLDIENWLQAVIFSQSGGQVLYSFDPAMARQWLISETGLFIPGVLAFDFWNRDGILTNRQNPNTLLTAAVSVKLQLVPGALSPAAQLIIVSDGLQTTNLTSSSQS